jgi:hypothetical protein
MPARPRVEDVRLRTALLTLAALAAAPASAPADPIHFVVAERPGTAVHGDSFVLALTDPAHVEHARRLIAEGPAAGPSIVLARIAPGADGVNRDLRAPGAPPWSWHVAEFKGFVDFSAEVLDGWPTFVEQDVPGWVANTGGDIGFWNYTVVAEVRAAPEPSSLALLGPAALALLVRARLRRRRPSSGPTATTGD